MAGTIACDVLRSGEWGPLGALGGGPRRGWLSAFELRQGWVTTAPAVMALERAVVGRRFRHGGHPLLRWCFENVAVETDKAGNRMFHKGRSRDRIDGAGAAAMAVGGASVGESGVSVYATDRPDGLIFL